MPSTWKFIVLEMDPATLFADPKQVPGLILAWGQLRPSQSINLTGFQLFDQKKKRN